MSTLSDPLRFISKCCGASVCINHAIYDSTKYYVCNLCGQSCDCVVPPNNAVTQLWDEAEQANGWGE